MDLKLGLGLSEGGAANPPTMGPAYSYSWAADLSTIPLNFGSDTDVSFPCVSVAAAGQLAADTSLGPRIESKEGQEDPVGKYEVGFPREAGTAVADTSVFFPPHASHTGIPIAALSAEYKYFTMVVTVHSTLSYGGDTHNQLPRNSLELGDAGSSDKMGSGSSDQPHYINGVETDELSGSLAANLPSDGSEQDKILAMTWDLSESGGVDFLGSISPTGSFDLNEISHHPTSGTGQKISVTYHGFIISSEILSDVELPIHTSRPAI